MKRFAIPCLLLAVAASNPASARQLGAELGLRPVQIPANLFVAPPASFTESPTVERLCMADAVRPPIVDRAGRDYGRDAELRKLLADGRQIAELSYQWAYAMATNQMLLKLPVSPAERADASYNVSLLNEAMNKIEGMEQRHLTALVQLETAIVTEIERAGRPATEVLTLLQRLDLFLEDDKFCSDRAMGRDKPVYVLRQQGWPQLRFPIARSADWNDNLARKSAAQQAFNAIYLRQAVQAYNANSERFHQAMEEVSTVDALNAYVKSVYGNGRLFRVLQRAIREFEIDVTERAVAITHNPGRDRSAKRMADMFKTNGSPDASDIIDLIAPSSMASTLAGFPAATATKDQFSGYTLTVLGGRFKILQAAIGVKGLKCKAVGRTQACTYTETFNWTEYKLFEHMVIPRGGSEEAVSGVFEWTPKGLQFVDNKKPMVSYIASASSRGGGGGSSGSDGARRSSRTFADDAMDRERDNRQEYDSQSRREQYNPMKRY